MAGTANISPLTRIEGHLAIHTETEPVNDGDKRNVRVKEAKCEGEMFRGFETILQGRDPLDAQQITQRICGVCPISHGIASVRAQEMAYGITPSHNGRLLQNLILAANYLQSHILHFYQLSALDFVDVTAILKYTGSDQTLKAVKAWVKRSIEQKDVYPAAPFLPRYEADYLKNTDINVSLLAHYVQALRVRTLCHEMGAVFGAKLPHSTSIVPGGCTQIPSLERVLAFKSRLTKVREFIEEVQIPDILEVAKRFPTYFETGKGYGNFLSFGVFLEDDQGNKFIPPGVLLNGKWQAFDPALIAEDIAYSKYSSPSGLHPFKGELVPDSDKAGAYSWMKAPRYTGHPMEVGPLARVLVNYHAPQDSWIKSEVDGYLTSLGLKPEMLVSVLGRHLTRGLEALWIARKASQWLDEIEIDGPPSRDFDIPASGSGYGLTEAPRGALGHWIVLENYRIKRYQCVVPTTWNCSPRDDRGQPGPVEKAIEGTLVADATQPMEVARIVRSFDPCIACAVH